MCGRQRPRVRWNIFYGMLSQTVRRRQRGSFIDTWAPIRVLLDVLARWSRLIIFFLNAYQLFSFGLYRTIRPFRLTSRVHPYIKTWTFCFGREKRWLLWDHNSISSHGSIGTFGRRGTTNSSMEKMYPPLTPSSMRPSRQNVGGRLTKKRKQMRIMTIPQLQRLRQCPFGYSKSLLVKLMHHGSIMAVSVA